MAFEVKDVEGTIAVIVSKEKCITTGKKGYEAYLKSFIGGEPPDETLLGLNGEPTRFICKRVLNWHQTKKMRKTNIVIKGRKVEMDPNFTADMVRRHVVDIKNPDGVDPKKGILTFSKDEDGLMAIAVLEVLDRAQVLGDLITAIRNSTADKEEEQKKP